MFFAAIFHRPAAAAREPMRFTFLVNNKLVKTDEGISRCPMELFVLKTLSN